MRLSLYMTVFATITQQTNAFCAGDLPLETNVFCTRHKHFSAGDKHIENARTSDFQTELTSTCMLR